MKKFICFWIAFASCLSIVHAQTPYDSSTWVFTAEGNLYVFEGQSILLPILTADHNKLHLEARYNYEDLQTFSGWAGYNFSGGKKIEYTITPMVGIVTGLSNGFAPGLEFTFSRGKFELYNESEYFFDRDTKASNFLYSWMDLTYSIKESFFVGLSAQHTRLYQTKLDVQRGLIIGGRHKNWTLSGYLYNLGFDAPFGIIVLGVDF